MPQFVNFYENLAEAKLRLEQTIVLYDGVPHYVYWISEAPDGRLKAYLDDYKGGPMVRQRVSKFPRYQDYHPSSYHEVIAEWYKNNKGKGIVRKELGSPHFNKFRPFPLGNVNTKGSVIYTERTPTRNTNQGLRERSVFALNVCPVPNPTSSGKKRSLLGGAYTFNNETSVDVWSEDFYNAMCGIYPSPQEILEAFKDPAVINTGVAFHREFSIFRGPLDMLILCYRDEGIGLLPNGDLSQVLVGQKYTFLKETLEELGCFGLVATK
jgi:hypothetical protein